jgi:predicted RNA-binding Zn ribbon-like protein
LTWPFILEGRAVSRTFGSKSVVGSGTVELTSYSEHAARLVNTADPGRPNHDALRTLDGLRGFLDGHPLWQEQANQRDLSALRQVRDRLRAVFEAADAADLVTAVDRLNALLRDYPVQPQLSGHDGTDWHLHLAEGASSVAAAYATVATMGLAVFCAEYGVNRLGVCQAPPCRKVFLDTSTNRSRRYCSDRCATRANVAAYRQRRRDQSSLPVA